MSCGSVGGDACMRPVFATSVYMRMRGLLGRRAEWLGDDGVLVFAPCSSVHTFGMRQAIDIAFVAPDGTVLYSTQRVGPGHLVRCADAVVTLERFSQAAGTRPRWPWPSTGDRICLDIADRRVCP